MKALKKRPDERLLIEAAQKDPARFAELYDDNFDRVYAFVSRRVQNRPDAEDLTAEVFHQALAKIAQFEWRGVPFAAWLYRMAANAIADRWQRAGREKGSPLADDPPDVSGRANPEEVERRARTFRLVAELPDDQRRVIEMRFAEEKSIAEIARELKRSAGAIKQLQFRALTTLRARSNRKASEKPSRKSGGRNG
ncbi:MAG: sigma-70 family RNA polymerase sigma factor [Candidatus Acidoferrales bacterium]|nr:sigma-70 family RNA polymerase sigma factor [Candidatus Acidoferrales bacterium]